MNHRRKPETKKFEMLVMAKCSGSSGAGIHTHTITMASYRNELSPRFST